MLSAGIDFVDLAGAASFYTFGITDRGVFLAGEPNELDDLAKLTDRAVLEPARWEEVCDALARFMGGVGTVLVPEAKEYQTGPLVASASLAEYREKIVREDWHLRSFRRRVVPLIKTRGYGTDLDIADAALMAREPFYTELITPMKLGVFLGLHIPAGRESYFASVERSIQAPLPDAELFARAEAVLPLLAAAARASSALGNVAFESWTHMSAAGGRAVFVIDHLRRVVDHNAAAEALLGDELKLVGRQLQLGRPVADGQLQHLVALATLPRDDGVLPRPVFTDMAGHGAIMFDAVRVPAPLRYFHSMAAALVVVRQVGELRTGLPALLKQRLNFTEAETRVALALFEGRAPHDIAVAAGLSVGTIRQQIKSLLRKSGTGRQAELVAVMRRLADGDAG